MKQQKQKKKPISIEKAILLLAAGFAAYNFGLAGGYVEGSSFSVGGLIAGLVVNITLALAASRFGGLKGDKRTRQAVTAFIGMLFLSPALVSPVIFYRLPDTFLGVWWLRALWAVGWPLVADLAIVLAGAVSGKGLIAVSTDSAQGTTQGRGGASQSKAVRQKYPRKCDHCPEMLRTPNAVGAHMKKHHPELCKPKPRLADALFTPVEKKQ